LAYRSDFSGFENRYCSGFVNLGAGQQQQQGGGVQCWTVRRRGCQPRSTGVGSLSHPVGVGSSEQVSKSCNVYYFLHQEFFIVGIVVIL
jgi:hypothetical protein